MNDNNNSQTNLFSFMLTTKLIVQIYEEVKKAFLKKDGTPFKREKRFWIRTLINIVAKILNLKKEIVEIGVNKLIDNWYIVKDYMDHIYYYPEFEESVKALNGVD